MQVLGGAPRLALEDADGLAKLAEDSELKCVDFAAVRAVSSRAEELLKRERSLGLFIFHCSHSVALCRDVVL